MAPHSTKNHININLSAGYAEMGRLDLMKQSLDACTPIKCTSRDIYVLIVFLNNQIIYPAEIKDFDRASFFCNRCMPLYTAVQLKIR